MDQVVKRNNFAVYGVTYGAMFFEGAVTALLIATMSLLAQYYGKTDSFISTMIAIKGLSTIITLGFSGRISDRYGRKIIVPAGAILFILSLVLLVLSNNPVAAIFVAIISGVGHGLMDAPAISMLVDVFGDKAGPSMSFVQVFFASGMYVITFATSLLVKYQLSWQWLSFGLIIFAIILIVFTVSVSLPNERFQSNIEEEYEIKPELKKEGLWLSLIALLFTSFTTIIQLWLSPYLMLTKSQDLAMSLQSLSYYHLGCLVGALIFAWILTKVHSTQVLVVNGVIALIAFIALLFIPSGSAVYVFIMGNMIGVTFSLTLSIGGELFKSEAGKVTGYIGAWNNLGNTGTSLLSGLVYPLIGFRNLFFVNAFILLGALLMSIGFRSRYKLFIPKRSR